MTESVGRGVLVGNPNTGKSTLFGVLSGLSVRTANYPGVTIVNPPPPPPHHPQPPTHARPRRPHHHPLNPILRCHSDCGKHGSRVAHACDAVPHQRTFHGQRLQRAERVGASIGCSG